jgi:response regulator RpfG family c-di-GMP phosphodiesterase
MTDRVLCVDDDPNILEAYRRQLRREFAIETARDAEHGFEAIRSAGPYSAIVSDMRMPGMDGIQFLARVKAMAPESVRIMLTGLSDQDVAMDAVNEGSIFRFLTKPCPAEKLAKALHAAVEQYRLVIAEKELLEKTLRGCVKVLTEVLSLVNPTAFGRGSRVHRLVLKLAGRLNVTSMWELDIAAMLSQIGCVTLPPETVESLYLGRPLSPDDTKMFHSHPSVGRSLVANIPRLETVAEIIGYQEKGFDGAGVPTDGRQGRGIPLGARLLKVALDFDMLRSRGLDDMEAVNRLRAQPRTHDPDVLAALGEIVAQSESYVTKEVGLRDLAGGMILAEDLKTRNGLLLVCKGNEVTPSLCQRLENYARKAGIHEPIRVLVRSDSGGVEEGSVPACVQDRR